MTELERRIKRHEGCRFEPYKDSEGILTAGYGRNLEAVPFSQDEVDLMFANDLDRAWTQAAQIPSFHYLNEVRQGVVVEMIFQLGLNGTMRFKKFWAAVDKSDWGLARHEMMDSKWSKQTPSRAKELSEIFFKG